MDSVVVLNKTKRFFLSATRHYGHHVFFHSANSLTLNTVRIKNRLSQYCKLSAITKYIRLQKAAT